MQNATLRSLVAVALLAAGAVFVVGSGQVNLPWSRTAPAPFTYVADIDFWQRSERERVVGAIAAFDLGHNLDQIPLSVGDWQGEDVPESNQGVFAVLEPEQYVERLYHNAEGQSLWLTMIGGRSTRTFHPPEQCYESYGWQTALSSHAVTLDGGGQLYGLWIEAHKRSGGASDDQYSFYFYLFPQRTRQPADGIVIFRVTSSLIGSVADTRTVQENFVRLFFKSAEATGA